VALDACRGQVLERQGGEMGAGIMRDGGRAALGGFYRARATRRCGGGEVVRWPVVVGASKYRLREWRVGRRGNREAGRC
jgi:hypothetical protein